MGKVRQDLVQRLWRGQDPFAGFPRRLYEVDLPGWGDNHIWLVELIDELRPRVVLEIGVWKGASVVRMATRMQELRIDGAVIAADTWLGSTEHWINDHEDLAIEGDRPARVLRQVSHHQAVPVAASSLRNQRKIGRSAMM